MIASGCPAPLDDGEIWELFAGTADIVRRHAAAARICVGVSGGADSMALMVLAARWRDLTPSLGLTIDVVTVDHRLRPESEREAIGVAAAADRLGCRHVILAWDGPKPATGVMAAAREARLRLLVQHARRTGAAAILLAHTSEDQAETVLMRLARGSGVDGLAGMSAVGRLHGVAIVRPLLMTERPRLVATLERLGIAWFDDPSNDSIAFERVRVRREAAALDRLGLSPDALGLASRRLARAAAALADGSRKLLADPAVVSFDALGVATLDAARLGEEPEDLRVRVLQRVIEMVGGRDDPGLLSRVETLIEEWPQAVTRRRTVGRVVLSPLSGGRIEVLRETGRQPLPTVAIAPAATAVWDGRFEVAVELDVAVPIVVAALDREARRRLDPRHGASRLPARVLATLPGVFGRDGLIAAPLVGYGPAEVCTMRWIGAVAGASLPDDHDGS